MLPNISNTYACTCRGSCSKKSIYRLRWKIAYQAPYQPHMFRQTQIPIIIIVVVPAGFNTSFQLFFAVRFQSFFNFIVEMGLCSRHDCFSQLLSSSGASCVLDTKEGYTKLHLKDARVKVIVRSRSFANKNRWTRALSWWWTRNLFSQNWGLFSGQYCKIFLKPLGNIQGIILHDYIMHKSLAVDKTQR